MSALSEELSALDGHWISRHTQVPVGPAPPATQLAVKNPLRWAIVFALNAAAGAEVTVSPDPTATAQIGWQIIGPGALRWNYRAYPGWTGGEWWASADVVHPVLVDVWELLVQQ